MVTRVVCGCLLGCWLVAACGDNFSAHAKPDASHPDGPPGPERRAMIYAFSDTKGMPNLYEIDDATNQITRTAYFQIGDPTSLTVPYPWASFKISHLDGINSHDANHIWIGVADCDTPPTTGGCVNGPPLTGTFPARALRIDLENMTIDAQVDVLDENFNIYMGHALPDGRLFAAKNDARSLAEIDSTTATLIKLIPDTVATTVMNARTCDIDAQRTSDGVNRVYYVTRAGDTTVMLDADTEQIIKTHTHDTSSWPHMVDIAPDGRVWVTEAQGNKATVLDPITLDVIGTTPAPPQPIMTSWSPDGKTAYITGFLGQDLLAVDNATLQTIAVARVADQPPGQTVQAQRHAPHPNGKFVYVTVLQHNEIAVVSTQTWEVVARIPLQGQATGVYVREVSGARSGTGGPSTVGTPPPQECDVDSQCGTGKTCRNHYCVTMHDDDC